MADRKLPYGAFNFLVDLGDGTAGGFSDVSGLSSEITVADYRTGNDPINRVHKVPGIHKVGDVTLKRGIIKSADLWAWIDAVRTSGVGAKRDVTITLLNESGGRVQGWQLKDAVPLKYTGPTLAAKGGGDVAMEELVLNGEELLFLQ